MSGSVTSVWLFSAVDFQMSHKIACVMRCKVALVAPHGLFSANVNFHMSPQIVCPRGCKVALFALIDLFYISCLCFHHNGIGLLFKNLIHGPHLKDLFLSKYRLQLRKTKKTIGFARTIQKRESIYLHMFLIVFLKIQIWNIAHLIWVESLIWIQSASF